MFLFKAESFFHLVRLEHWNIWIVSCWFSCQQRIFAKLMSDEGNEKEELHSLSRLYLHCPLRIHTPQDEALLFLIFRLSPCVLTWFYVPSSSTHAGTFCLWMVHSQNFVDLFTQGPQLKAHGVFHRPASRLVCFRLMLRLFTS